MRRTFARFKSKCGSCGGSIAVDEEIDYDADTKTAYHLDHVGPGDHDRLAGQLGFLAHEVAIRTNWWSLFLLQERDPSGSTGRDESEAHGRDATLLDEDK